MANEKLNCSKCRYRIYLAKIADIHVWKEDCDKYGTDLCKTMNESVFITEPDWAKSVNVKVQSKPVIHSYGERKDNE